MRSDQAQPLCHRTHVFEDELLGISVIFFASFLGGEVRFGTGSAVSMLHCLDTQTQPKRGYRLHYCVGALLSG